MGSLITVIIHVHVVNAALVLGLAGPIARSAGRIPAYSGAPEAVSAGGSRT